MPDDITNINTESGGFEKNTKLLPHHLEDLHRSGLTDDTIETLGFYSGTAAQVKAILGFDAGTGLIIPYPSVGGAKPFWRVKPDHPPIIRGTPAKPRLNETGKGASR